MTKMLQNLKNIIFIGVGLYMFLPHKLQRVWQTSLWPLGHWYSCLDGIFLPARDGENKHAG